MSTSRLISLNTQRWLAALLILGGATAIGFLADTHTSLTNQAMVYVLAVVFAAYALRWEQSVACAVGAVGAFNFFFVPPRWTFEVASHDHLLTVGAMLLVALLVNHLVAKLRDETFAARINETRALQLQTLAQVLSNTESQEEVIAEGIRSLDQAFTGTNTLLVCTEQGELAIPSEISVHDMDGLRCCMREKAVLGPGTGRWPGLDAWFIPLFAHETLQGAARIAPALAADSPGRAHAQALCALIAQALHRLQMQTTLLQAKTQADRQQIQSTYVAAISHDLRTPLAALVGSASALQTQYHKLSQAGKDRLLEAIVREARYLNQVSENTLQLLQLENAPKAIRKDWQSMEEVVGAVLTRIRAQDTTRRIHCTVAPGIPLVQADAVLLAQLISNLLENALKYSDQTIELVVAADAGNLVLLVKDRGPCIPPEKYQAIFEPYSRNDQSGQRGTGLGLALCKAIAQAHGGTLGLRRRAHTGNTFVFTMPLGIAPEMAEETLV
ncbi:ATP-binding protein [Rhodoferax aquaticus]|uniref:histidine kinase n=1 Tax=Rhodoferax aquaticus TaxID=2527691 RepID=A0A515EMF1_9BURK|nr:ATP-binding protein [Rhodoferax aquaticus]QDL53814.1 DUF4118 domain-containing protein [Rhodoferax aquaticus]